MQFGETKRRLLTRYRTALEKDLVDEDIIPINKTINSIDEYVTTSSCTGRAILISKKSLRSKYNTKFHHKTHEPNKIPDIITNLPTFSEQLWFIVEPPNIHIRCKNTEAAWTIHQKALESKLSKSKFQSLKPAIVVEILGTGSLQIPLGKDNELLVNDEYLEFIFQEGRKMLETEQKRLQNFHRSICRQNY